MTSATRSRPTPMATWLPRAAALRERAHLLDGPKARPLPELLQRPPLGRGPQRPRPVHRPSVLRRLRRVLRALFRPRLRLAAAGVLPADPRRRFLDTASR